MESSYHWEELKWRIFYVVMAIALTFIVGYEYREALILCITYPILNQGLYFIYTDLSEAFFTSVHLSLIFSMIINLPVISYQLWAFLRSGLYQSEEKKLSVLLITLVTSLEILIYLLFSVMSTVILPFFLSFQTENLEYTGKLNELISFLSTCLFGIVIIPIIIIICFMYLSQSEKAIQQYPRRAIILCSFILGSIFTPPDIITQIILASFLIILLEISLFLALLWQAYLGLSTKPASRPYSPNPNSPWGSYSPYSPYTIN